MIHNCDAGRRAKRWAEPCPKVGVNVLSFSQEVGGPQDPMTPNLYFCMDHMAELIAEDPDNGGAIVEPNVGVAEWNRRQRG